MASATGQELVGLKHPEIVHSAVVLVLKDEGFSLPTVPAQMARQTAEKLLEWNSENKAAWQSFSESLVNTLSTCFELIKCLEEMVSSCIETPLSTLQKRILSML